MAYVQGKAYEVMAVVVVKDDSIPNVERGPLFFMNVTEMYWCVFFGH